MEAGYKINLVDVKQGIKKPPVIDLFKNFDLRYKGTIIPNNKPTLSKRVETIVSEILKSDEINAEALKKEIFPQKEYTVFVSHSHSDIDTINALSKYLADNNIDAFVDAVIWDDINEILNEVIKRLNTCEYRDIYGVITHFNMVLLSSLSEMINKCAFFLFIESENALTTSDKTKSSWIHYELLLSSMLKKESTSLNESKSIQILHRADLDHLEEKSLEEIIQICSKFIKSRSNGK